MAKGEESFFVGIEHRLKEDRGLGLKDIQIRKILDHIRTELGDQWIIASKRP